MSATRVRPTQPWTDTWMVIVIVGAQSGDEGEGKVDERPDAELRHEVRVSP
jgi:hypothetical protein